MATFGRFGLLTIPISGHTGGPKYAWSLISFIPKPHLSPFCLVLSFVPTILLDGSQKGQKDILKNLLLQVCRVYNVRNIQLKSHCCTYQPEYTQLLLTWKYLCIFDLLPYWFAFNQKSKSVYNFNKNAYESKVVRQVSHV